MGLIDETYLQELTEHASASISNVIGVATSLKKTGKDYVGLCVFHEEKTPSLHVNNEKGCYHCLGCNASGNALGFLQNYYNLPFPQAVARLAQLTQFHPVEFTEQNSNVVNIITPIRAVMTEASACYATHLITDKKASAFAKSRGITTKDILSFNIGSAPDSWNFIFPELTANHKSKALTDAGLIRTKEGANHSWDVFRNRLMFPLRAIDGQIIAFGARSIAPSGEAKHLGKYINTADTPIFNKSLHLYGLFEASQRPYPEPKTLNIVEGYIDVLASHRNGFTNTVTCMGTAITTEQIKKAFRYCDRIRFVFDGDQAGIKAAFTAINTALPLLDSTKTALVALMPADEDPDSLLQQENGADIYDITLKKAMPCSQFIISYLKKRHPGETAEAKARLYFEVNQLTELINDPTYKQLLTLELKSTLGLEEKLHQLHCDVYKDQLHNDIQNVINEATADVKTLCGLLLHEPEWIQLVDLKNPDPANLSNQEVIDFTLHTLTEANSLNREPQHTHAGSMRFLVLYLQSLSPVLLSEKIETIKSPFLMFDAEKHTDQLNTHHNLAS